MTEKLVIIGGVAAGMKTAARARRLNPDLEIVVYQEEDTISYGACGLTYYISNVIGDRKNLVHRTPEFMKEKSNIDVRVNHRVITINPQYNQITVKNLTDGTEFHDNYDKLIIATGASPKVPDIEGIDLKNVFFLKSINDADEIKSAVKNAKKVVVAGAGFLGLELVEAMRELNIDVTMLVASNQILREYDYDVAYYIQKHCEQNGVKIYTGEELIKLEAGDQNYVNKVITTHNELDADLVFICKGTTPNTELAREAGIEIGETAGIKVNELLQTSVKNIYAGGDCAEVKHLITGEPVCYSSGSIANRHGKIIAENVCGGKSVYKGSLGTRVMKVFDMTVGKVGLSEREAKEAGFDCEVVLVPGDDRAHYFPGAAQIIIKMVAEKETQRVLGVQIYGPGEVSKRLDIAVVAITAGLTTDHLAQADLTYAPPYSPAMDTILVAANVLSNKLRKLTKTILPEAYLEKRKNIKDTHILLDVRPPEGFEEGHIEGAISVPFGALSKRMHELDKTKEIITQCKIGKMSYMAFRKLKNCGYDNVKYLDGGVSTWLEDLKK